MNIGIVAGVVILCGGVVIMIFAATGKYHIKLGRAIAGLLVLNAGISMLTQNWSDQMLFFDNDTMIFYAGDAVVNSETLNESHKLDVIFSSATIDLRDLPPGSNYKIDVIFGSAKVIMPDYDVRCDVNTAFGSVTDDNIVEFFGEREYTRQGKDESSDRDSALKIDAVFGSVKLVDAP